MLLTVLEQAGYAGVSQQKRGKQKRAKPTVEDISSSFRTTSANVPLAKAVTQPTQKINRAEKSTPPTVRSASKSWGQSVWIQGRGDKWGTIIESNERNDHLQQSKLVKSPFLPNPNPLLGNSKLFYQH